MTPTRIFRDGIIFLSAKGVFEEVSVPILQVRNGAMGAWQGQWGQAQLNTRTWLSQVRGRNIGMVLAAHCFSPFDTMVWDRGMACLLLVYTT